MRNTKNKVAKELAAEREEATSGQQIKCFTSNTLTIGHLVAIMWNTLLPAIYGLGFSPAIRYLFSNAGIGDNMQLLEAAVGRDKQQISATGNTVDLLYNAAFGSHS